MRLGYVGPATLVTNDGVTIPVTADLERRARLPVEAFTDGGQPVHCETYGWCGAVKADEPIGDHARSPLTVRFPGGGEAEVRKVSIDPSDPLRLRLVGYGGAPWSP